LKYLFMCNRRLSWNASIEFTNDIARLDSGCGRVSVVDWTIRVPRQREAFLHTERHRFSGPETSGGTPRRAEERQQILERWFVPSIAGGLGPSRVTRLALTVALPTVALVTFVLYWVLRLRPEVRWRKEAQLQAQH
jgi:hypothetical protein